MLSPPLKTFHQSLRYNQIDYQQYRQHEQNTPNHSRDYHLQKGEMRYIFLIVALAANAEEAP